MNISRVSPLNFKGIYLSKGFLPTPDNEQYTLAKDLRQALHQSKVDYEYERKYNQDILINEGPNGSVNISLAKYDIERVDDDNYARWDGSY